ncbi:hypothetical protein V7T14_15355 [Segatella copri]|uniref:hypothetical protein n=1 Tax=Segatella copri TaxID=165179 RepID=UPI001C48D84E|nr:hypothetical protein [Segatella copri]MBW0032666.1 hypothetical protein [Segatella copri]
MKKLLTLVAAALMAVGVNAQTAQNLFFGGAGTNATIKTHDGSSLHELFTCTEKYGAINLLGGKKSISGDEYKGLKVFFFDLKNVDDKGVNIHVGVKKSDYSTSYGCDIEQFKGLSGNGEMEVEFKSAFKGKKIDLLDLQGEAPGVEVDLREVYLIKNDGSLEEVPLSISFGWNKSIVGKAAYADPTIVFPGQWSLITVSTDEAGTLATFDVNSGEKQEYIVEFEEPTTASLNLGCNTDVKDETVSWDAKIALYFPIEPGSTKASCVISKDNVLAKTVKATKVINVFLQNTDSKAQTVKIKSIKRVTTTATDIPRYTFDLANVGFSNENAPAIGGWNGLVTNDFKSEIIQDDGVYVDRITFTQQDQPHNVQVDFENVYPRDAKIQLTMVARGDVEGSIKAALQNPNGYEPCGDFEDIKLTTGYQTFTRTVTCSGDNARRLLLNVGTYAGTIYIKSVKIEALEVPQETVTISSSGYSTYAAYYPVNYAELGLKAYAVKFDAKDRVTFTDISGVVPAGVPVLLKGDANKKYVLDKAVGGSPVSTDLKMSDGKATSTDAATLYALATVNDLTAFYRVKKDPKIPIPAKRCYLEVKSDSANAAFYSLGTNFGETTGISSVENKVEKADAPVYNLAGQLVGKDYKGLVIKNGKKFVIK